MALLEDCHPSILPSLPLNTCSGQSSCCTLNYARLSFVFCGNRGRVCWIAIQIVGCVTRKQKAPITNSQTMPPTVNNLWALYKTKACSPGAVDCVIAHTHIPLTGFKHPGERSPMRETIYLPLRLQIYIKGKINKEENGEQHTVYLQNVLLDLVR